MKPGCSKCFKEAVKVGNEYICPACGEMVAQIPTTLSVEDIKGQKLEGLQQLKPGDIVRHKKDKSLVRGMVQAISKSGLRS